MYNLFLIIMVVQLYFVFLKRAFYLLFRARTKSAAKVLLFFDMYNFNYLFPDFCILDFTLYFPSICPLFIEVIILLFCPPMQLCIHLGNKRSEYFSTNLHISKKNSTFAQNTHHAYEIRISN